MTARGGEITTRTSCLCWAAGGIGVPGYGFPAWGYDAYAWYWYNGPIYTGYANLTPDRVVVEVQQDLAADGYYAGPIDGRMGPQTRAALAAFQADNGLAVTSAIDEPTLQTLGLA